ncbi:MAG: hypothetical protein WBD00_03625 [Candidatus Omnitrophota bacterium]
MKNNNKGFSLVEVLIVSFFLVLLVVAVVTSGVEMRSVFQATGTSATLQQEARIALNVIISDLRGSSMSVINITEDSPASGFDKITYKIPLDVNDDGVPDLVAGNVTWDSQYYTVEAQSDGSDYDLVKYKLWESPEVISENIKSITFEDSTDDTSLYPTEVRITLELEKIDGDGRVNSIVLKSTVNTRI